MTNIDAIIERYKADRLRIKDAKALFNDILDLIEELKKVRAEKDDYYNLWQDTMEQYNILSHDYHVLLKNHSALKKANERLIEELKSVRYELKIH